MNRKKAFGTTAIARICHVTPPTVSRWIAEGKFPCFTTGGGHRRVWAADLMRYLSQHNLPIPPELESSFVIRALIVDDEASVRKVLRRIIAAQNPNIDIHEAADGFEAGHKVASLAPHIVILDFRLPGVDGIKVCELIRSMAGLQHTKILAISGYNVEETAKSCLKAGADAFLGKPFDPKELSKRLQAMLHAIAPASMPKSDAALREAQK